VYLILRLTRRSPRWFSGPTFAINLAIVAK
jgi:hypothetical protein